VIDIPFYARQNTFMLINLDSFNKLPKPVQEKLVAISVKFEPEMKAYFEKQIEAEKKEMEKLGVQRIKLSDADTKKFLDAASDAFWEDLEKKTPEETKALKKLLGY
jgi:TRAP-type C4-dicarboxylate transport system substrate-binding protein